MSTFSLVTTLIRWLRRNVAVPEFFVGMGSVLDVAGVTGPTAAPSTDPWGDDGRALAADTERLGGDLHRAVGIVDREHAASR